MDNLKLKKANDLKNEIQFLEGSLEGIVDVIKELELDNYFSLSVVIKVDRKQCQVSKETILKYLRSELESNEMLISKLKQEFNDL